jgi:hypothetical protein
MKGKMMGSALFAVILMLAFAGAARATDGTIEINQAKVTAGGGFPYPITTSGSYRLTSNLVVSATNTDAIDVTYLNVTIDLNGFSILGPGSGTGIGINGKSTVGVTVKNGSVLDFGSGVWVGNNSIVKSVNASFNSTGSAGGIEVGNNSVVETCTANSNSNARSPATL